MVTWVEVWERTFEVLMIKLLVEEEEVELLVEEAVVVNVEVVGVSTGKFKAIIITNSWVGVANE